MPTTIKTAINLIDKAQRMLLMGITENGFFIKNRSGSCQSKSVGYSRLVRACWEFILRAANDHLEPHFAIFKPRNAAMRLKNDFVRT